MGYRRGALLKENINPAEVMSVGVGEGRGRGGNVNPSSYVLGEMEKTNIWPSAVGYQLLNDCASGKKHHTLAIAEVSHLAKCGNFCLITHLSLFLCILCA